MRRTQAVRWSDLVMMTSFLLFLGGFQLPAQADEGSPTAQDDGTAATTTQGESRSNSPSQSSVDSSAQNNSAQEAVSSQSLKPVVLDDPIPGTSKAKMTEAERIALLQRLVMTNRKELEELKRKRDAKRENQDAQKSFEVLDNKLDDKKSALEEAKQKGQAEKVKQLTAEVEELQKPWQLAKDRFDLDLRERKTVQERIVILEATLKHDQGVLDVLLGNKPVSKDQGEKAAAAPAPDATAAAPAAKTASEPEKPAPASPASPPPAVPLLPGLPGMPIVSPSKPAESAQTGTAAGNQTKGETQQVNKDLVKAEEQVKKKAEAVSKSELRSQSLEERLENVDRSIKLESDLLETARLQESNARQSRDLFNSQVQEKTNKGATPAELAALRKQIDDAEGRVQAALKEIKERELRLRGLNEERNLIVDAQHRVSEATRVAKAELEKAESQVHRMENPLAPQNVLQWFLRHGLAILAILASMILLQWLMGRFSYRVVKLVASRGMRGSKVERENRANTLVSVFSNAATLAIVIGGVLMIFDEAGVPIGPLIGGAAVFGLAVAFGAQNLIRDYFYGFMILLENQYKLNDVVQIGDHSGQVEQITLRMTALRDLEGNIHFLPNGTITSVINMTHGWSRALFDVGIAYKEDVDRVMDIIADLGKEMRHDPAFRLMILEDLTMLGVDSLGDSSVVLKFYIKTLPIQQWTIKREFLRRLKKRFDELGIEIPFPHRTLVHRTDNGSADDLLRNLAGNGQSHP